MKPGTLGYVMAYGVSADRPVTEPGRHPLCVTCAFDRSKWAWLRFHQKDPQAYLDEACEPIFHVFRCEECGRIIAPPDLLRRAFGNG